MGKSLRFLLLLCLIELLSAAVLSQRDHHVVRRVRTIINQNEVPVNVEWLTDEQLSELGSLDSLSQIEKIRHFYDSLTDTTEKQSTAKKIVTQCYDWLPSVTSEEERDQLKQLHHSDHSECKQRIGEYLTRLPEEKQTQMRKYWSFCEHVYYETHAPVDEPKHAHEHQRHHHHHRRRRDHHQLTIEELFKTHLSWLTEEQKEQLKAMKAEGKPRSSIQQKILEIYDQTTGEVKEKATAGLQNGCREVMRKVIGNEKADELKAMKESGATNEEIGKKADQFLAELTDEDKKAQAKEYGAACKLLFNIPTKAASRRRRDHHIPDLEELFKTHLSWLDDSQKEQLKTMKAERKARSELQQKVLEFFDQATGETKEKATAALQDGCRGLLKKVVGLEKADEIKSMKESGVANEEITKKIDQFISELVDEDKKNLAKENGPACRHIFNVKASARRRRDHHVPNMEELFKTHLSWLDDAQKEQMKTMEAEGKPRSEMRQKIIEFYDQATGETKEKATAALQNGCKEMLKKILGQEKAEEIKAMKESGSSYEEISKKVDQLLSEVTDGDKKEMAEAYGPTCRRIFNVKSSRKRRDHHQLTIEELFKTHLSWLTEEQKEQLKAMKAEGKPRSSIQQKILEIYDQTTGEVKEKATAGLQNGCREVMRKVIGNEKADELKAMKESGATNEEIGKKADQFLAELTDEDKKAQAKEYGAACKLLFNIPTKAASRRRRDQPSKLEEYFNSHLSWLTDAQKEKLRTLKASGKSISELQEKIFEFYDQTTGETKQKATELMQTGCRQLVRSIIGDKKADQLKAMKETGASNSEMEKKFAEFVDRLDDEEKKKKAVAYAPACKRIFNVAGSSRRRRDHHHHEHDHTLEGYLQSHLSWLTDVQKEELKTMKAERKGRAELQKKVFEFYDQTTGEAKDKATQMLQGGCRELVRHILGEDKAAEIKAMKESGSSNKELSDKIAELVSQLEDGENKTRAAEYAPYCRKVYGVESSSRRRRAENTNNGDNQNNSNNDAESSSHDKHHWLSDEQKEKIKTMKEEGESDASIHSKLLDFFHVSSDDVKTVAKSILVSGCEQILERLFGEEKAEEISEMRKSGASASEIEKKVGEYAENIEDENARSEALKYSNTCRQVLTMLMEKRKRRAAPTAHSLDDYFRSDLVWLKEEQRGQLRVMQEQGSGQTEMQQQVLDFYAQSHSTRRQIATHALKRGCKELLFSIIGEEKAERLIRMHENGATKDEWDSAVNRFFHSVEDERLKSTMGPVCRKAFRIQDKEKMKWEAGAVEWEM